MNKRDRRMVHLTRPLPALRIRRWYNDLTGQGIACWLDSRGDVRGWYIMRGADESTKVAGARGDGGWGMTGAVAGHFNTNMKSIRHALTAEEEE